MSKTILQDADDAIREAIAELEGAVRHGDASRRTETADGGEPLSSTRRGVHWDSLFRLKPLVLAVVFVLVIAGELVDGMDGITAGAVAVMWTALVALGWEIVARISHTRQRTRAASTS
jgi:hypothetical protein